MNPQNANSLSKPLPFDCEAERIGLGCVLVGHTQSREILQSMSPTDFFDPRHRTIFEAMQKLWSESHPVEAVSLYTQLAGSGRAEDAGGAGYIATVGDGVHARINADHYTTRVTQVQLLRELIRSCQLVQETAFSADREGMEASSVLDLGMEKIAALREKAKALHSGLSKFDAAVDLLCSLKNPERRAIQTGLSTLDSNIGGMRSGEIVILTAETGVGKTFLALQIAGRACESGQHTLFCSGEMLA